MWRVGPLEHHLQRRWSMQISYAFEIFIWTFAIVLTFAGYQAVRYWKLSKNRKEQQGT